MPIASVSATKKVAKYLPAARPSEKALSRLLAHLFVPFSFRPHKPLGQPARASASPHYHRGFLRSITLQITRGFYIKMMRRSNNCPCGRACLAILCTPLHLTHKTLKVLSILGNLCPTPVSACDSGTNWAQGPCRGLLLEACRSPHG